jgi:hypothetical protein
VSVALPCACQVQMQLQKWLPGATAPHTIGAQLAHSASHCRKAGKPRSVVAPPPPPAPASRQTCCAAAAGPPSQGNCPTTHHTQGDLYTVQHMTRRRPVWAAFYSLWALALLASCNGAAATPAQPATAHVDQATLCIGRFPAGLSPGQQQGLHMFVAGHGAASGSVPTASVQSASRPCRPRHTTSAPPFRLLRNFSGAVGRAGCRSSGGGLLRCGLPS